MARGKSKLLFPILFIAAVGGAVWYFFFRKLKDKLGNTWSVGPAQPKLPEAKQLLINGGNSGFNGAWSNLRIVSGLATVTATKSGALWQWDGNWKLA